MKKINEFINEYVEKASLKRALLATMIFGVLFYIINYSPIGVSGLLKLTDGANILDFEDNGYSLDKAYTMLKQLGENGRHFYLTMILPTDILFPIGVMLFGSSWMSLFLKKLTPHGSLLRWLPCITIINMFCDWGENIGFTLMLINYPVKLKAVCAVSSFITRFKFICVETILISLVILFICIILKVIVNKIHRVK